MEPHAGSRHLEIVLLNELSAGTFARLYLAEARAPGGLDRIVAVKILREQWNESDEIINRTRDEARLLARLRHKNILRVEDLSEIDGQLAIIMEFVDGLDLKQLVEALSKRGQRVPARAALQIAAEAASALEAAYFKIPYGLDAPLHVVHRDIKPSNVMVSVEGELKVLDFGTARSSQAFRSVQTGALRFGSLKYMSPERREGDRGEHAADVYALGLMLLEILKGEWLPLLPMDVAEHDETVADEIGRLGALGMPNREWDIALRQVLLQMLAGDPTQRPTAEQVARLLRAFVEQAAGETLDTFARDTVAVLTRQVRGNLTGGALAGTRFVVAVSPGDAKPPPAPAPAPARPAAPAAPSRAPEPAAAFTARSPTPAPSAAQAAAALRAAPASRTFDDELPTQAGVPAGVPAPAPLRDPGAASRPLSVEVSHAARPEPARNPAPAPVARPPAEPPPRADAPPPRSGGGVALAAGGLLVLVALACAGVLGAGGIYYVYGTPSAAPTAPPPPGETTAPQVASASGGAAPAQDTPGASVRVRLEGAPVQWIRVHDPAGQRVADGQEELSGNLPLGTYELSLKLVGRPALKGTLEVPGDGVALVCQPGKESTVTCAGAAQPLTLQP
jgi:serine/threonine-protein kinase